MKEILILLLMYLISAITVNAQEAKFAQNAEQIAQRIDSITSAEKKAMKIEIKEIDQQLEKGEITYEEAKTERERIADIYALRIEKKVNVEKAKLDQLVAQRVEKNSNKVDIKILNNEEENDGNKHKYTSEKRTTSQFVFAVGLNTLEGEEGMFPDDLKVWPSRFWEFGISRNTRLAKNSNLTHIKYGLSLVYNNLKPKDNQIFTDIGEETVLVPSNINFDRNRFRNFYLNIPVHLELDFSPTQISDSGKRYFKSHKDFRIGLGGYVGILINSKNFLKYREDGHKVKYSIKDDYNVNDFNYGLSGYIGYKEFSLYTKYDLQPLFKNNPANEHNFSIGVRWDWN